MRSAGTLAGLDVLSPGDHVCWVVDVDTEYERVTRACLDAGAAGNDKVVAFGPDRTLAWARGGGALVAADPHTAYLGGGPLVPETMFEAFRRETDAARSQGYRGLRVVADMDWLLPARPGAEDLLAFEVRLDEVVAELGATVVCAYRTATFTAEDIDRMLSVHPLEHGADVGPGFRMWNVGGQSWRVSGEIDFANADAFRTALAAVATPGTVLSLRLDDLAFADVAALRAMASVADDVPGLWLRFEGARPTFRRCWELLGLDVRLPSVEVA